MACVNTACPVRVTIFSTGGKFWTVSNFTKLQALTLAAHSYVLLPPNKIVFTNDMKVKALNLWHVRWRGVQLPGQPVLRGLGGLCQILKPQCWHQQVCWEKDRRFMNNTITFMATPSPSIFGIFKVIKNWSGPRMTMGKHKGDQRFLPFLPLCLLAVHLHVLDVNVPP